MKRERPSYGERVATGGIGGALAGVLMRKNPLAAGALGAGSNAVGFGASEDPVTGGALSGATFGAGLGVAGMKEGSRELSGLVKHFMMKGLSKKAAILAVMGGAIGVPAAFGGAAGAAGGGMEKLMGVE